MSTKTDIEALTAKCSSLGAADAARELGDLRPAQCAQVLEQLLPNVAQDILAALSAGKVRDILAATPADIARTWRLESKYPQDSIGSIMEPPLGVFHPDDTVGATIEKLREISKEHLVTYCFVTGASGTLVGVVTMRDLLLSTHDRRLEQLMLCDIFSLRPETPLLEAMKATMNRHYPVYPVCTESGGLLGLVRGQALAEAQAFELSAQAGSMVGVEKEERLATPVWRSFLFRHPWLQLNLLTAFIAAAVVGIFESTLEQIVLLAVFLPVLAGQSGNTGCQALAVSLRAMTLGELKPGKEWKAVIKEATLGLANGALVGLTAGAGMVVYAHMMKSPVPWKLGGIVFLAMIGSCVVSGACGALVPTILRRLGADPATASSIFLTTATDVVSMGLFLGLATWLIL
ncbi:MAG: magnesium transporter [Chthoniobacterales bacterium]|nr:magnesium transporter [Chthoniobacterales bacterium]